MAAGVRRTADFKVDIWGQGQAPECSICLEEVRSGAPVICHEDEGAPARDRHPICLDCYVDACTISSGSFSCPECRVKISTMAREIFEWYRLIGHSSGEPMPEEALNPGSVREEVLRRLLLVRERWIPGFLDICERNDPRALRVMMQLLGDHLGADVLGPLLVKAFEKGHYLIARQLIRSERFPRDFPRELLKRALASVGSTRQHGWLVGALVNSPACAQVASAALKAAAQHGLDEAIVNISRHAEARQHILLQHVLSALGRAKQAGRVGTIQVLMQNFSNQAWRLPLLKCLGEFSEELPIQEVPVWALDGSLTKEILDQAIALGHDKLARILVAHPSFQSPFVIGRGIIQSIRYQRDRLTEALFHRLSVSLRAKLSDWAGKIKWITAEGIRWALPALGWFPVIGPAIIAGVAGLYIFRVLRGGEDTNAAIGAAFATGITIWVAACLIGWGCAPALGRQITKGIHFVMPNLALRLTELWHGQCYSWLHLRETRVWLAKLCISVTGYTLEQGVSRAGAGFTRVMGQHHLKTHPELPER